MHQTSLMPIFLFYGAINETPDYLSNTTAEVSTDISIGQVV